MWAYDPTQECDHGHIISKTKVVYQYYCDILQVLSAYNCHKYEINKPIEIFHMPHTAEIVRLVVYLRSTAI